MSEAKACSALNAADAQVGAAAQEVVRLVLAMGANAATLPLELDGKRYVVKVAPAKAVA
jgi:hypothetical protein